MKNILYSIGLLIAVTSCQEPPFDPPKLPGLSDYDKLLIKDWQYQDLIIEGDTFNFPYSAFEPTDAFYPSAHVRFRTFSYLTDLSYEYIASYTRLGPKGTPNWQPNYGYWRFNANGDTLIHNGREPFSTKYRIIELTNNLLIREYERIVQETSYSLKWPIGDTVTYREILVPKIN